MGWLDNAARQSRLNRLRRASYKLPLQVPAAKIVIDDPVELKYEAASCCCKDSVLTKVLTKVLLVDGRHVKPPWAAFERRIQPSTPQGDSTTASGALPAPNRSC